MSAIERQKTGLHAWATVVADEAGGNGSAGVGLQAADYLFTEQDVPGLLEATFPITAGTTILDMIVYGITAWASDVTAYLDAYEVSGAGATGFYMSSSLQAFADTYVTLGSSAQDLSPFAYISLIAPVASGSVGPGPGVRYTADDGLYMKVLQEITTPPIVPTGETLVRILYLPPITANAPAFTPAP